MGPILTVLKFSAPSNRKSNTKMPTLLPNITQSKSSLHIPFKQPTKTDFQTLTRYALLY